ncbi:hypothetical protein [Mucilaginibacter aquatilis]|uniref:DUF5655 domain-containing protein n=1 Tax=Mucilaginibacter aquatilis TaxID=1517760 RepID=A0A6I4IGR4_9SPHI|nr:hypothetical protein [Mucilaginibacter aquatilis]MVN92736.1 hypothetical protein [Mucilaginibacter aquatilis]
MPYTPTHETEQHLQTFLNGKSDHTLALFHHFVSEYKKLGNIILHPTKTMIGIGVPEKRIAWITQLGKNFIHVVFPFHKPYEENLCFAKIAQVPGQLQFNHHLRMLQKEDLNDEVLKFMQMAMSS